MNRAQLRAEVALRLRIPPTGDPLLDDVTLNNTIRAALIDIASVNDFVANGRFDGGLVRFRIHAALATSGRVGFIVLSPACGYP